jgi:hypothetical protein
MHDRALRVDRPERQVPAAAATRDRSTIRRTLRVGAADDAAEREADDVAARVVAQLGPTTDLAAWEERPTRIAPGADPGRAVIRRVPYLSDRERTAYRDSEREDLGELAYAGQLQGVAGHLFVRYASIDRVQTLVDQIARGIRTLPETRRRGGGAGGPIRRPRMGAKLRTAPYRRRNEASGGDLESLVRVALAERLAGRGGSPDAAELRAALGPVYCWIGEEYVELDDLDERKLAALLMRIANKGGTLAMIQGSGSRLPDAVGTLYTLGPISAERISDILGADVTTFANVQVMALEPDQYVEQLDRAREQGANLYALSWWTGEQMFYVSTAAPSAASNRTIQIGGRTYTADELAALTDQHEIDAMRKSFGTLRVASTDWIPGTQLQVTRARESGQTQAMNGWNAKGVAAYAKYVLKDALGRDLDLGQDWEWLHVRAAQLGGATANGNLVPGLFATNSAMIAYEALVKNLAIEDPTHLQARFEVAGGTGVLVERIILKVRGVADVNGVGHRSLGTEERTLLEFDPLHGRVVDRLAAQFIQRAVDRGVSRPWITPAPLQL